MTLIQLRLKVNEITTLRRPIYQPSQHLLSERNYRKHRGTEDTWLIFSRWIITNSVPTWGRSSERARGQRGWRSFFFFFSLSFLLMLSWWWWFVFCRFFFFLSLSFMFFYLPFLCVFLIVDGGGKDFGKYILFFHLLYLFTYISTGNAEGDQKGRRRKE